MNHVELNKVDVIALYKQISEEAQMEPHDAFLQYLEHSYDENESLEIILPGNHKYMFTDRITDNHLIVICKTLEKYSLYIEIIDKRIMELLRFDRMMFKNAKRGAAVLACETCAGQAKRSLQKLHMKGSWRCRAVARASPRGQRATAALYGHHCTPMLVEGQQQLPTNSIV